MENNTKKTLEDKLASLREQLDSVNAQDPYKRESYADENTQDDDASEREEHARVSALKIDIEKTVTKVEEALKRVSEDKYGVCVECGKHIDKARLQIIPEASRCINCSRHSEKNI